MSPPYTDWIGRSVTTTDVLSETPLRLMRATLDEAAGPPLQGQLPPLWHWLYFLPGDPQSQIGPDGHARRGGFLPPVELPRRMWAGGRFQFLRPLELGATVERRSTIRSVQSKTGRSGELVFVTVQHDISDARGLAWQEDHDIVYREAARPDALAPVRVPAPTDEQFAQTVSADAVRLMRYSALTFNGHRIHYDRSYAMQAESYPGLVVHGPLIATLLLETLRRAHPERRVTGFEFKAVSTLFDLHPFTLAGKVDGAKALLWARGPDGALAMQATATLA